MNCHLRDTPPPPPKKRVKKQQSICGHNFIVVILNCPNRNNCLFPSVSYKNYGRLIINFLGFNFTFVCLKKVTLIQVALSLLLSLFLFEEILIFENLLVTFFFSIKGIIIQTEISSIRR